MLHSRPIRKKTIKLRDTPCYEPQDRLNGTGIRLVHTKAEVSGHITIEVEPSSRVNSQCGDLYEVMTVSSRTAAKKRWYCVLVENNLYLQTSPRDQNHKKVMPMKHLASRG